MQLRLTYFIAGSLMLSALVRPAPAQQQPSPDENSKRIFWIIPNFRTAPFPAEYKPITVRQKFAIASQDTFDRGTVALAALFAGESQLTNSDRSFGQGVEGYAHYFGTSYADFAVGNFMTEAIGPTLFHQDPRFFRKGKGSFRSRLFYAAGQIFLTHGDNGHTQVNVSELAGNSAAVAISMSYYPEQRDARDAIGKLGAQLGVDMASNILKEFAPDLARKFSRKHRNPGQ
jgi:hypothetical protein